MAMEREELADLMVDCRKMIAAVDPGDPNWQKGMVLFQMAALQSINLGIWTLVDEARETRDETDRQWRFLYPGGNKAGRG